jgi:hypothetical protein
MAEPETPKSRAAVRAERKADRTRMAALRLLKKDAERARSTAKWFSPERRAHDKKVREYSAELQKLKNKK